MSRTSLGRAAAGPAAPTRAAGPRLQQRAEPTHTLDGQHRPRPDRRLRLLAKHVGRRGWDSPRRTVRQDHRQHQLALQPPKAPGQQGPAAQRMPRRRHPHFARQNLTKMLQCGRGYEYLWTAAGCLYPDLNTANWVHLQATRVLQGRATKVAGTIRRTATNRLDPAARQPADDAANYLTSKAPYLDYPTALANGWPIATGIIEGACRHLVKDRMDITGARWGLAGAEAILKLRALKANGDFDAYWQYHLTQERHHIHKARYLDHAILAAT